jgi:pimeloyl-ACP methyl ester carboxylesterase
MTPVTFANRNGQRLAGILHEPPVRGARGAGVILLSPGMKNRVAPHRLYCKMAAAIAARGFPVLRFDFYGLGDSEGTLEETQLADVYRAIQTGRYVDDTRASMDWMARECGVGEFIVGGLCGGAITGLLAARHDKRVSALLAIGIPAILDSSSTPQTVFMTQGQLGRLREGYLRKLTSPSAWLRLFTLKTDVRQLLRALRVKKGTPGAPPTEPAATATPADNTNPLFAPALLELLGSRRPALLLFSGADRLYWEFEEKFLARHREAFDRVAARARIHTVADANHVLTFEEWQQEAFEHVHAWLDEVSPATPLPVGTGALAGGRRPS